MPSLCSHATLYLDGYLMGGDGVVKAPPPHGVKPKLTDALLLEIASAKEYEQVVRVVLRLSTLL